MTADRQDPADRQEPADWQVRADRLAAESLARGEPCGWFDRLFAEGVAGVTTMPWDRIGPQPVVQAWAAGRGHRGGRAAVPGCGLGADAAFLAGLGYDVIGFDVSPTAVELARQRHPGVTFQVADLFALPPDRLGGFDLVLDVFTVQAMPRTVRSRVIAALRSLVAPGGTLVAVQFALPEGADPDDGPPWPLTRTEIETLAADDLPLVSLERRDRYWLAELHRA